MIDRGPGLPRVMIRGEDGKPRAWVTYRRKDGTGAHSGTLATNPEYVKRWSEWLWLEVPMPRDSSDAANGSPK